MSSTPTPETIDEWSEDDLEAFNAETKSRLAGALDEETSLSADEQQARDTLVAIGNDRIATESVALSEDVEIEVRRSLPGRVERKLDRLGEYDSIDAAVDDILDIITAVVVGPDEYASRDAWKSVYDEHGSTFLMDMLDDLTAPAHQSMSDTESFREE